MTTVNKYLTKAFRHWRLYYENRLRKHSITLGKIENTEKVKIDFKEKKKKFDPEVVYKNKPNPTKI